MILRIALALVLGFATLSALAAPVPKEAEKFGPPTEKQLKESRQNLKKIGLAIHSYYDTVNQFPGNAVGKDGVATLSWRVLLLTHLEEADLYNEFKFDEPWDSKHNKALIEKRPKVYEPIRVKAEKGHTYYRGFNGPDTIFETGKNIVLNNIPDGSSNTLMVVEAGESCVWTKPDDLPYDAKKPIPKLGGMFEGDFHILMADGAVHAGFGSTVDAEHFHLMITKSDGMVVDTEFALGHEKKK